MNSTYKPCQHTLCDSICVITGMSYCTEFSIMSKSCSGQSEKPDAHLHSRTNGRLEQHSVWFTGLTHLVLQPPSTYCCCKVQFCKCRIEAIFRDLHTNFAQVMHSCMMYPQPTQLCMHCIECNTHALRRLLLYTHFCISPISNTIQACKHGTTAFAAPLRS